MISSCLNTLQRGGAHLASAPTGIGKTAAALAAALEFASKSDQRKTVMFLTPRQSQHRIVVDTVRRINSLRDEKITLVDMIGQSGMCVVLSHLQAIGEQVSRCCVLIIGKTGNVSLG